MFPDTGSTETLDWHDPATPQRVAVPPAALAAVTPPPPSGGSLPTAVPPFAADPALLQGLDPHALSAEIQRRVALLRALQNQYRLPKMPSGGTKPPCGPRPSARPAAPPPSQAATAAAIRSAAPQARPAAPSPPPQPQAHAHLPPPQAPGSVRYPPTALCNIVLCITNLCLPRKRACYASHPKRCTRAKRVRNAAQVRLDGAAFAALLARMRQQPLRAVCSVACLAFSAPRAGVLTAADPHRAAIVVQFADDLAPAALCITPPDFDSPSFALDVHQIVEA